MILMDNNLTLFQQELSDPPIKKRKFSLHNQCGRAINGIRSELELPRNKLT